MKIHSLPQKPSLGSMRDYKRTSSSKLPGNKPYSYCRSFTRLGYSLRPRIGLTGVQQSEKPGMKWISRITCGCTGKQPKASCRVPGSSLNRSGLGRLRRLTPVSVSQMSDTDTSVLGVRKYGTEADTRIFLVVQFDTHRHRHWHRKFWFQRQVYVLLWKFDLKQNNFQVNRWPVPWRKLRKLWSQRKWAWTGTRELHCCHQATHSGWVASSLGTNFYWKVRRVRRLLSYIIPY